MLENVLIKLFFLVKKIYQFRTELTSSPRRIILKALLLCYFTKRTLHIVVDAIHLNSTVIQY